MRLSSLVLVSVGTAALGATGWICWKATEDRRAWNEILSYQGKNIHTLGQAEWARFKQLLHSRLPPAKGQVPFMEGWAVVPLRSPSIVVILEAATGLDIPGDFPVNAHVFTLEGRWLSS